MKKIKLTVASILLSGICFAQSGGHDYCQSHWTDGKVVMDRFDHLEAINTVEDMIEWMNSDIDNLTIDQEIGGAYVENLNDLLLRLRNKSILIENED